MTDNIEQRAREWLAVEYEIIGLTHDAKRIRSGDLPRSVEVRAIAAAIRGQHSIDDIGLPQHCADEKFRAFEWLRNLALQDGAPAEAKVAFDTWAQLAYAEREQRSARREDELASKWWEYEREEEGAWYVETSEGCPDEAPNIRNCRRLYYAAQPASAVGDADKRDAERMQYIADYPGFLRYHGSGRRNGKWSFCNPLTNYEFDVFDTPGEAIDAAIAWQREAK